MCNGWWHVQTLSFGRMFNDRNEPLSLLYQRTDKMLCICHDYKAKQFQFTLCIYRVCSGTARTGFGTLKREEPELWCRVIWNRLCIYIVPPKTQ